MTITLQSFLRRREEEKLREPQRRTLCLDCFQPEFGCYCAHIQKFDPKIQFVILIHPVEIKRRIATGRMSHLSLSKSLLVPGCDYSTNRVVNEIIENPANHSVMLYPGSGAVDLSALSVDERCGLFPSAKRLVVFVIDGTWATARKMVRSRNLAALPRICFSPQEPSRFRVRKQPKAGCYSTIEAVHQTIELVGEARGFDVKTRRHDALLEVFDTMVERQLACIKTIRTNRQASYRREL